MAIDRLGPSIMLQQFRDGKDVSTMDARLADAIEICKAAFEVDEVHVRIRERQSEQQGRKTQYEKRDGRVDEILVQEGAHQFVLNLSDYLDTGIFLDHRDLRARCAAEVASRVDARDDKSAPRFLNLFAYTCTASVYAAAAGAVCTSVDLSSKYLAWGESNFCENNLDPSKHRFLRTDVLAWLRKKLPRFDVILLNPPSYSRSKRMDGDFDVQRDHGRLIDDTMRLLAPNGVLYFSTHARRFELDGRLAKKSDEVNTVPKDFRKAHRTWRFTS